MEIINYHEAIKGSKLGHFKLCITKWEGITFDMTLFQKNSHRWVSFPTQKYQKDGQDKYAPQVFFQNPETTKRFQEKVLKLLDEYIAKQQAITKQEPKAEQFDLF